MNDLQAFERALELFELRLFLEDICCDLCRFQHILKEGRRPEEVRIDREVSLADSGFADIRVRPGPGAPPYVVEVKYGYPTEVVRRHLLRKYGPQQKPHLGNLQRLIVVLDVKGRQGWQEVMQLLQDELAPGLTLEVWDEEKLLSLVREAFEVDIEALEESDLMELRDAIDEAKGRHAFGESKEEYVHDPLRASLLWHFGFWRLRQRREEKQLTLRELAPPGMYRGVICLIADLSSFSAFVRDTPDESVVRQILTAFYTKARYQVINSGGMLSQFVGDEVVAFFGLPDRPPGVIHQAVDCAVGLLDIGRSVASEWQRHIDRVQQSGGMHIGMSIGDVQMFPQRPFSRTHMGAVGDTINLAARLMNAATANQLLVSNSLYRHMPYDVQGNFVEAEAIEARNVGRLQAWRWNAPLSDWS